MTPKSHHSERLHHPNVREPIHTRVNIFKQFKQSFFVQAINFWNKLSGPVLALESISDFGKARRVLFEKKKKNLCIYFSAFGAPL